jgi:polyphosphate kinase 2 (PPK2 family)
MLEKIDLSKELDKKEYKARLPQLQQRLYDVQKTCWDAKIPTVILFEGWDAVGKGKSINLLTERLDPRGFKVHPIRPARSCERARPWLWRFWLKLPNYGRVAIFDRTWYGRVLEGRVEKHTPKKEWRRAYRDIVEFERQITDDDYVIVKFWLHISKKEQKRRLKEMENDPLNCWRVTPEDWTHHKKYEKYLLAVEEMLERTETEYGPWTIIEATDRRWMRVKIFETIIRAMEDALEKRNVEIVMPEAADLVDD